MNYPSLLVFYPTLNNYVEPKLFAYWTKLYREEKKFATLWAEGADVGIRGE